MIILKSGDCSTDTRSLKSGSGLCAGCCQQRPNPDRPLGRLEPLRAFILIKSWLIRGSNTSSVSVPWRMVASEGGATEDKTINAENIL